MTQHSPQPAPGETPPDHPLAILCVDDDEVILKALARLFRKEPFQVLTASSGKEGLSILSSTGNIGLILSDQRMPGMSGTEFLRAAAPLAPDTPKMIMTGHAEMSSAIEAINQGGACRFLTKPWDDQELLQTVREGVQRYELLQQNLRLNAVIVQQKSELEEWNANLKSRVLQQSATIRKQLEETHRQSGRGQKNGNAIISLLADLLSQRHHRLSRHSRTVAALAASMAKSLELPQIEEIKNAALLHDIGLIGVSDRVLGSNNAELLRGDDVIEYRSHPVRGQETIDIVEELQGIGRLIRHHHEGFDGSGFPDGLAGEEIPLGARIIHLASFIDNSYSGLTGRDAKYQLSKKVTAGMGILFDPSLAAAANLAMKEVLVG